MWKPRILALGAALAVCACHGGSNGAGGAGPVKQQKPAAAAGPTVAELTAGMVEAPGTTKSDLGLHLKFALGGRPAAGQPLDIELALIPALFAESATVDVDASAGYAVAAGGGGYTVRSLEPSKVYKNRVTVTPTAAGVTVVGLTVTVRHDALVDTRKFAVPIIVGPGAAPAAATPSDAAAGAAADRTAASAAQDPR